MNLIVGYRGMVGSALMRAFEKAGELAVGISFSLSEPHTAYVSRRASRIFFCAAHTNVDEYETNSYTVVDATVNTVRAMSYLQTANPDSHLVFFSSGYVFGESLNPWGIYGDAKSPVNTYGMCKMLVEKWVLANGGSVVRTLGVFGKDYRRKNFVDRILDSNGACSISRPDHIQNWTHSDYLAETIVGGGMWGNQAYHIAGGPLARWEMAHKVCNRMADIGLNPPELIRDVSLNKNEAPRPAVCVLATKYGSIDKMLENYIT